MGWFYGFKLHLLVNDKAELIHVHLTPGNVDEREVVENLTKDTWGKLFADKGYISSSLCEKLLKRHLHLITPLKKNMKNKLMTVFDKVMLRKRRVIETINDPLKTISQIEHTRHRSGNNFWVNLLSGLIA